MKNILVIVGSGTKDSNTLKLADEFIKGVSENGHVVNKVFLGNKKIVGCTGCGVCQTNDNKCAIKDDMQELYPFFEQCDTIVFASPLYFWTITAKTKAFIERLYAISTNDKYPEKDTYLLMTAGDDQFWTFEQPVSYYHFLTKALGWNDKGMYLAGGCRGGVGKSFIDEKHLKKSYELGKQI